ncbi:hypothetical protein OTSGILL_1372 [Orientia tsutsugamushi str. Gilliam]|uniref:Uncharacterized protein n=1 Tax=Orientia tsutsugamushi str. Gilliam TaxID=1359184 RepID=A0A0F3MB30_ORITS|nr:hypothetical protein [Orientia tsutsugamushi]KJV52667.1 hypothetical protein OTSGILL_1372 [Orientia tsutsugamushi str. Gilliam]
MKHKGFGDSVRMAELAIVVMKLNNVNGSEGLAESKNVRWKQ